MIINPNNRLFDRVPDLFESPYPSADVFADGALEKLMARSQANGLKTIGDEIMAQAGAQAWNQATQLLWKTKATVAGDVPGDIWGRVAWIDSKSDTISGLLAEIPFGLTADSGRLLGAMAGVGVDLALNAVSAIPVAGWIIGIVVGIARALANIFRGLARQRGQDNS